MNEDTKELLDCLRDLRNEASAARDLIGRFVSSRHHGASIYDSLGILMRRADALLDKADAK